MSEEQIATFIISFAFAFFLFTFVLWATILITKKIKTRKSIEKILDQKQENTLNKKK